MRLFATAALSCGLFGAPLAQAQVTAPQPDARGLQAVSPALERYERDTVFANLWQRPNLSPRDRSIVTLAALVTRNQTAELPRYLALALDSGVTPAEVSELITHLAFYAGLGNAMPAMPAARQVFESRGIGAEQLPAANPDLLPLDQASEAARAAGVAATVRPTAPGLEQFTTDTLFRDLWLRPGLAPRDRSLVTVSALLTAGHAAQLPYHLGRAMDHGLTRAQASEIVAHLAFYAGWPNAFSAVPVVKSVFDSRPN
ncbi:MAG: carboxymuconolactone decarboxylase family protein [Pseudomonadota bacterium]